MSYGAEIVIDADTEEVEDEATVDFERLEKATAMKNQRVATRRRVEEILARKAYDHVYGDPFGRENF